MKQKKTNLVEKSSFFPREKISNFVKSNYKKIIWTVFLSSLVLSFIFYAQTEAILHLAAFETFTWLFLVISISAFIFRKKIETFFLEKLYDDPDYLDEYYSNISHLNDAEKAKVDSPSQPLKRLMLFVNFFLWLNVILFIVGKTIGGYVGFNIITAPLAVLCLYGQMYLAYKTIQLMSKNIILFIRLKSN